MTKLLVLGLLKKEPLSGYDIQTMLAMSDAESWGGVLVGSIYHALKTLDKDGYIEIASIEQTGHRQKAIYRITDTGIEHLNSLILEALQTSSVSYPTALYSGLNFMNYISVEQCTHALESQKKELEKEINKLHEGLTVKKEFMNEDISQISKLAFENMFSIVQQQLNFIDKVIQLLNN